MKNTSYSTTAKILHWTTAFIWIGVWCMGMIAVYGRDLFNVDHTVTYWHKAIASTLFLLVGLRIIWRVTTKQIPELPNTISPRMKKMATAGHHTIYLFALVLMPLSGWFYSSAYAKPIMVLGLFELPPLIAYNETLQPIFRTTHYLLAWFCGVIIGGHILMALKHHFILRNSVLKSMLPFQKKD